MSRYYLTRLHVPVRRHYDTFDNFFMNRFRESMDAEVARRLWDWERQLESIKRDFFQFSPRGDANLRIDANKAVKPSPAGSPEFAVQFDVQDFNPEDLKVSTKEGMLEVSACHEEKNDDSVSRREFKRIMTLPKDVKAGLLKSVLSEDGILSVTAPMQSDSNESPAITSSDNATQQAANVPNTPSGQVASKEDNSHQALNYSMSVAGFTPQEVTVYVEGNKVKIHAKHDEVARGKETHKEMTKVFELPPSVDADRVRSVINNDTLYIEAHLKDDMAGDTHIIPIEHKDEPKPKNTAEPKAEDTAEFKPEDSSEPKAKDTSEPKAEDTAEQNAKDKSEQKAEDETKDEAGQKA